MPKMSKSLSFRANSGIKDILGRGLILDDNIAIVELIKNSKDASSPCVKIHFKEKTASAPSELILTDFGHGMSFEDIHNKWLNIAYSEKKEANTRRKKAFAGSKGVGRFSCDRLGKKLTLYTKSTNGDYIKLPIDWERFETGLIDAEISTVELLPERLSKSEFLNEIGENGFDTGTVLRISELRSTWEDKKIQKLTSELEKFISDPDSNFKVSIKSDDGPEREIKNSVFEELALRTYNITSQIDGNGKKLATELKYQGETIYSYEVDNPYPNLKNVKVDVHYMDFSSKLFFKRKTGYAANDYGSIFMYLNGFRISPFGNPKNDWLSLDQRKTQGTSRFLGTRDVIGKVSVIDAEDRFKPITSREGLVQDVHYQELTAADHEHKVKLSNSEYDYGFVPHIIRQLERFIVEGLNWSGLMDLSNPSRTNISEKAVREDPTNFAFRTVKESAVKDTIDRTLRTSKFDIKSFKINEKLITHLASEARDAYNEYVLSFIQNTTDKSFEELSTYDKANFKKIALSNMEAIKAEKLAREEAYRQHLRAEEAERKAKEEQVRAEEAEKREKEAKRREVEAKAAQASAETDAASSRRTAQVEKKRRLFAEASQKPDSKKNEELVHHIRLLGDEISGDLNEALDAIRGGEDYGKIEELVKSALFQNDKLLKLAKIVSKAGFEMLSDTLTEDIFIYVSQYLEQLGDLSRSFELRTYFNNSQDLELPLAFSPIEVTMLVDNILDNAANAGADSLSVFAIETEDSLELVFKNNGGPLTDRYLPNELFSAGITTTSGSGVGLAQVKRIASSLDADVSISNRENGGVSVSLRWSK